MKMQNDPRLKSFPRFWRRSIYYSLFGVFQRNFRNPPPTGMENYPDITMRYSSKSAGSEVPPLNIAGVIDPLSLSAQRLAPLLEPLLPLSEITLNLIPETDPSSFPLPNFYRATVSTEPISFDHLPSSPLLTLRHDVAERWNIQYSDQDTEEIPSSSPHDFDNLKGDVEFANSGF